MASERSRYRKRHPLPPFDHKEINAQIKKIPREELDEMISNFSSYSEPLRKLLIILTAIENFKDNKNYSLFKKEFLYAVTLEDHVPYNLATEYHLVTYPILEFFKANKNDDKLIKLLQETLPTLEESSYVLQDENSWYDRKILKSCGWAHIAVASRFDS